MGSNVPPITPIRPPTTERAYPVPRRPPAPDRAQPQKRNRRPRGDPGADGPLATGSPVQPVANSPGDRRGRTRAVDGATAPSCPTATAPIGYEKGPDMASDHTPGVSWQVK